MNALSDDVATPKSLNEQRKGGHAFLTEDEHREINQDETCGYRLSCGTRTWLSSVSLCQPMATAEWALFLFCIANMTGQTVMNGLYGVCVSTLEKRFELRSTESGLIASCADIGRIVGTIFLAFFTRDLDRPRWIGWGVATTGIGTILFAMPHFLAPEYRFAHGDIVNYCGNVTEPECGLSSVRNYRFVFVIAVLLIGFGFCPQRYVLTYLDENVNKKFSGLYNAIYLAMGGLGPAIGFLAGGASLELYTYIGMDPKELTITSSDYQWIGAWWIGFVICGVILLLNAIPLLLLPKYIPGTEKHRQNRNVEAQKQHLKKNVGSDRGHCSALSEMSLLFKNKPYIFITLGMTLNSALIYGFNTFGAKYLESVFGLTPFHSSLLYGVCAIFASAGAQLFSGFVIKHFNLDVQGMMKFIIIVGVISAICSIGFLVHCDEIDFAGGTVPYTDSGFSVSLNSSCNDDCGCSADRYQPICASDVAYFSPCFAGCKRQINETTYENCSCVMMVNSSSIGGTASSEYCDRKSCNMIVPFIFIIFFCFFSSVLTLLPSFQVTMRCVPFSTRDLALLVQSVIDYGAGIIPGRILAGFFLDYACVAWSTECGEEGSCKSYRRWEIARNNTLLLFSQTVGCGICYALVYATYDPAGQEESKDQGNPDGDVVEKEDSLTVEETAV